MPTGSLRAHPPPLRFEVQPLARLSAEGRLDLLGAEFPPEGDLVLVLWRPGERPAFALHQAKLQRGGRATPGADAWVVLWAPAGAIGTGARVQEPGRYEGHA